MRLKMRETRMRGIKMKANETIEAIMGAYFLPTMGLNPLVISLLALFRYNLDVEEIISKSGNRVSWNLEGRSRNSATKSSSSAGFLLDLGFFSGLLNWVLVWAGLVVMGLVGLVRSEVFLASSEVGFVAFVEFVGFEVELSFLSLILMMGVSLIESSVVGLVSLVLFLLELEEEEEGGLRSLVWFLVESEVGLTSLVWFLVDLLTLVEVGLMSLVLSLVGSEEVLVVGVVGFFFMGFSSCCSSSSSSCTCRIPLLPKRWWWLRWWLWLLVRGSWELVLWTETRSPREEKTKERRRRKSKSTFLGVIKSWSGAMIGNWVSVFGV